MVAPAPATRRAVRFAGAVQQARPRPGSPAAFPLKARNNIHRPRAPVGRRMTGHFVTPPRSGGNIAGRTISSPAITPSGKPPPGPLRAAAARQSLAAPIGSREDCGWAMQAVRPAGNSHAGLRLQPTLPSRLQPALPSRFHLVRASRRAEPRRHLRPHPGGPGYRRRCFCAIPSSWLSPA